MNTAFRGTAVVAAAFAAGVLAPSVHPIDAGSLPCDPVETAKVLAPEPGSDDDFGYSVAVSGTVALVTAWGDDDWASQAGSAFVFRLDEDGAWVPVEVLHASNPSELAFFGWSCSAGEGTLVVGAPNGAGIADLSGSAYVFREDARGGWSEVALLSGSRGGSGDRFGEATSICGDIVAIGARLEDGAGANAGAVHVFRESAPTQWAEVGWIVADDAVPGAWFGHSVDVCGDRFIVGALRDNTLGTFAGAAYIFRETARGDWTQVAKLVAEDGGEFDGFGAAVAIAGGTAVIGAPSVDGPAEATGAAYVFREQEDGTWIQVQKLVAADAVTDDSFGRSVALAGDRLLVGAHHYDVHSTFAGAAYLFRRDEMGVWSESAKLEASDGAAQDLFGFGVDLSGEHAIVGSHQDDDGGDSSGSAYMFSLGCTTTFGDLDGDGAVGAADLELLLAEWGMVSTCECDRSPADLDADGVVAGRDLGLLLGAWASGRTT